MGSTLFLLIGALVILAIWFICSMKILILILALTITTAEASPACLQIGEIADTIITARQAGMPKIAMIAALKISSTGVNSLDSFALNLVDEAYSVPKHPKAASIFTKRIVRGCNKMVTKHNILK